MPGTATQLTDKFRKDVEKVSQDKVRGQIVKRLRILFAGAAEIRGTRSAHGKWELKSAVTAPRLAKTAPLKKKKK